jgi:hypothetical protein
MDLTGPLNAFIEDMLGATGSFGLTELDPDTSGDAAPMIRLRLAVYQMLDADGWIPSGQAQLEHRRDAAMLEEVHGEPVVAASQAEDHAVVRAHQHTASTEAHALRKQAQEARKKSEAAREDAQVDGHRGHRDADTLIEQMRRAMESRAVIEQAKGVLMQKYNLTAEAAWNYLVRTSQLRNLKLRAIAIELVESTIDARRPAHEPLEAQT